MAEQFYELGERMKRSWPLWALAGFVFVASVVLWLVPGSKAKASASALDVHVEVQTNLSGPVVSTESRWAEPTKTDKVQAAIEQYTQAIEHDAGSPETADNVYRLANLYYSTLLDYEKASLYYVTLIQDYPEYSGIQTAFANLVTCYERLGKTELRRSALRQMMEYYGEGTEEYLFANEQLNR